MGYAVIMFVALMIMSVVMITAVTYGVMKDNEVAPLKAENNYAERETGKAQTKITIVDTCLSGTDPYLASAGNEGPYTLWLTVKNNGSTVLNPYNSTLFYNLSYYNFYVFTDMNSSVPFGNVWSPLKNSSIKFEDFNIYNLNYMYRLMMATGNGISAIAPTSPTNFSGWSYKSPDSYNFSWSSSADDTGIGYYLLTGVQNNVILDCPRHDVTDSVTIPGNLTKYNISCPSNCPNAFYFLTAVDTEGNMGMQSRTLNCNPNNNQPCDTKEI